MRDVSRSPNPHHLHLDDFGPAFGWLRTDLAAHESEHCGAWRRRSVVYHARHALVHLVCALCWMMVARRTQVDLHLTHATSRTLMALTRWSERRPFGACRPPAPPRTFRPRFV